MVRFPFSRSFKTLMAERQLKKELKKSGYTFTDFRFYMMREELSEWNKYYAPFDLKGKVVKDIGGGEGESAKFYLDRGASLVYVIEPDKAAFEMLKKNSVNHNIVPINKYFEISDLGEHKVDFIKIDIEGYEEVLLDHLDACKVPMFVEVHGLPLCERFRKAGFRIESPCETVTRGFSCNKYAYWKC